MQMRSYLILINLKNNSTVASIGEYAGRYITLKLSLNKLMFYSLDK